MVDNFVQKHQNTKDEIQHNVITVLNSRLRLVYGRDNKKLDTASFLSRINHIKYKPASPQDYRRERNMPHE